MSAGLRGEAVRGGAGKRESRAPGWRLVTPGGSHPHVTEIQRSRLISAAIRAIDELGYPNTSVAHITSRARVSRRTFYELFPDREVCLMAALEDVATLLERQLDAADLNGLAWCDRVREGLWVILSFLDREPVLARVCVVEAMRGGPAVLQRREALIAQLASVVDEGRFQAGLGKQCTALTAEGLLGATFMVIYARVQRRDPRPLTDLLGELMGAIVLPYLGRDASRREQTRPVPAGLPSCVESSLGGEQLSGNPLEGIQMRFTYRTMRVLECVSSHPGINNRQVGDLAGIADQGQVSKLLSRLRQVGLLSNDGEDNPRGMPNVWRLTATGERVAHGVASGVHLTRELHSAHYPPEQWSAAAASSPEIPDALRDPRSHRARCCLVHLAAHPGSSNREIADGVGISSHSQISTLLRRLCDMGMVSKRAGGAGQANAWVLTDLGVRVARAVSGSDGGRSGG